LCPLISALAGHLGSTTALRKCGTPRGWYELKWRTLLGVWTFCLAGAAAHRRKQQHHSKRYTPVGYPPQRWSGLGEKQLSGVCCRLRGISDHQYRLPALSQSRPNETGRRPFEQVISPTVLALDLPGCPCHRSNFSRSNDQIQRAFAHLETREVLQRADHKICKRRMDKCKHRANSQS
jgi:hypothetical protein